MADTQGIAGGLGALLSKFSESYGDQQDKKLKNRLLEAQLQQLELKNPMTMVSALQGITGGSGQLPAGTKFNLGGLSVPLAPAAPRAMTEKEQYDLDTSKQKAEKQSEFVKASAQDMFDTIQEVKKGLHYFGPLGGLPTVPIATGNYKSRKNWEVNINKLLSGQIINLMNEMKNASKTGATGFGQLSGPELAVLQGASTALKKDLDPADAERYLNKLQKIQLKVLQVPTFATEDEAIASGAKGKVLIGDRMAEID